MPLNDRIFSFFLVCIYTSFLQENYDSIKKFKKQFKKIYTPALQIYARRLWITLFPSKENNN